MAFDLDLPQFDTQELLACVRGLKAGTLRKWEHDGEAGGVVLSTAKTRSQGIPSPRTGRDILQVAVTHEFRRQTIFAGNTRAIWEVVDTRLKKRFGQGCEERVAAFFHVTRGDNLLQAMFVDERKFTLAGLDEIERWQVREDDGDDFPVRVLFRMDQFIDDIIGRMEMLIETREDYAADRKRHEGKQHRKKVSA